MKKILGLFTCCICLFFSNTLVFAENLEPFVSKVPQVSEERIAYIDEQTSIAMNYIVSYGDRVYFDYDKAVADEVSGEALDIGLLIETISEEHVQGTFSPGIHFRSASLPVHGNYCGPGHSGNNFTLPTIDLLDWGCKQHDQCYKPWSPGQNCACNRQIIEFIRVNRRWMPDSVLWKANAIKAYFETFGLVGC